MRPSKPTPHSGPPRGPTWTEYVTPVLAVVLLAMLVVFYWPNREFVASFKPYYLRSLFTAAQIGFGSRAEALPTSRPSTEYARSVPVLVYHGIVDKKDPDDKWNVTTGVFTDHMTALKAAGYQTVTLEQFTKFVRGQVRLPAKSVLLTFDDGRKDSCYPADPILKALGYNAVMFVIAGELGGRSTFYLNRPELLKMKESGTWELQPHTFAGHGLIPVDANGGTGYFYINRMWLEGKGRLETMAEYTSRVDRDLKAANSVLEKTLHTKPIAFAYPFGTYGQDPDQPKNCDAEPIMLSESRALYDLTFAQGSDGNGYSLVYQGIEYPLRRLDSARYPSGGALVAKVSAAEDKRLPYPSTLHPCGLPGEWLSAWGGFDSDNAGGLLYTNGPLTSALCFLDGSRSWRDYRYEADVNWQGGRDLCMLARYLDDENYVALVVEDHHARIEQHVDGSVRVLGAVDRTSARPGDSMTLGISVNGSTVAGSINGAEVIRCSGLNPALKTGGVGFKIWDKAPSAARVAFKNVRVTEEK
jgi:peptidoglycan/xylan/chitin deacetylase (PgdA/CDA1 family)